MTTQPQSMQYNTRKVRGAICGWDWGLCFAGGGALGYGLSHRLPNHFSIQPM